MSVDRSHNSGMFELNCNTVLRGYKGQTRAVDLAVKRFQRDISMTICPSDREGTIIDLVEDKSLGE